MNVKEFIRDGLKTAVVTLVVTAIFTYGYSWIVHGSGAVDWETCFQLAIIFGVVIPLSRRQNR